VGEPTEGYLVANPQLYEFPSRRSSQKFPGRYSAICRPRKRDVFRGRQLSLLFLNTHHNSSRSPGFLCVNSPGTVYSGRGLLCGLRLEFDLDLLEVGGADVFGGVRDWIAPARGASFGTAFDHFAVRQGDFQFSIGQKIRDVGGMRVHRRDLAGFEVHGEDANLVVFEDDRVAVPGDFDDVLGWSRPRGGASVGERSLERLSRYNAFHPHGS